MGGGASGLSRMMGGGEGGGASKRLVGSRSRSRRETPVGDAGAGVEDGGTRKKIQKRVVMTRGTTGMGMAIKTDLSTAAQNWNENVNVSRLLFVFPRSSTRLAFLPRRAGC